MARRRGRGERRYGCPSRVIRVTPYVFCVRLLDLVLKTHRFLTAGRRFSRCSAGVRSNGGWQPESGGDCKRQGFQEFKYQEENR